MDQDLVLQMKRLQKEEQKLIHQIETCELCISAVLNYVEENGEEALLTIEDILSEFLKMETEYRTEYLHLRLERSRLAFRLNQINNSQE